MTAICRILPVFRTGTFVLLGSLLLTACTTIAPVRIDQEEFVSGTATYVYDLDHQTFVPRIRGYQLDFAALSELHDLLARQTWRGAESIRYTAGVRVRTKSGKALDISVKGSQGRLTLVLNRTFEGVAATLSATDSTRFLEITGLIAPDIDLGPGSVRPISPFTPGPIDSSLRGISGLKP